MKLPLPLPFVLSLALAFTQLHAEWSVPVDLAGWAAPVDLSISGQNASIPKVATDPIGNAVAVWGRFNGSNLIIQAASLPFGANWTDPTNISLPGKSATSPQVAIDPTGNAVAIWTRNDGVNSIIQASTQTFGGGWSTPVSLSNPGQNATNPHVIIDQSGNAVAIWERFNGFYSMIQSAALPHNGSWSAPVDISLIGQDAFLPQLSVNLSGNVLAVWKRFNGSHYIIESASLPYGGNWSAPVAVSLPGQNADKPQISLDSEGEAIAVWIRFNGITNTIQASRSAFGGAWSTPNNLSAAGVNATNPHVGMALGGNAYAVILWEDTVSHTVQSLKMVNGVWQNQQNVSPRNEFTTGPQLAVDFQGNALAVWQNSTKKVIQGASLPFEGNWSTPDDLSEAGQFATTPQVTIDSKGNGIAVWVRSNGTHNIAQASSGFDLFPVKPTFPVEHEIIKPNPDPILGPDPTPEPESEPEPEPTPEPIYETPTVLPPLPPPPPPPAPVQTVEQVQPPTQFKGKVIKQSFLVQKVRVHKLTWKASSDHRVAGYLLTRNGEKLTKIPAKGPFTYSDVRKKKNGADVYHLSAYTQEGLLSSTVTVVL